MHLTLTVAPVFGSVPLLLESYPEKLAEAEQRLETVQEQMTNAKEEVGKPFPKEEELNQKLERLSELNALLNMDEREDIPSDCYIRHQAKGIDIITFFRTNIP